MKTVLLLMMVCVCTMISVPVASGSECSSARELLAPSPDAESQYSDLVMELTAALVDFTACDLTSHLEEGVRVPDEIAARRNHFETTLLEIKGIPPPPQFYYFYCNVLPFYEQILKAMNLIVDAAAENDKAKAFAARIWLTQITKEISIRFSDYQEEIPASATLPECKPLPQVPIPDIPALTIPFYSRADYESGELEEAIEGAWYEQQPSLDIETVRLVLKGEERYWLDSIKFDARQLYSIMEELEGLLKLYPELEGDLLTGLEESIQETVARLNAIIKALEQSLAQARAAGCHTPASWRNPIDEANRLVASVQRTVRPELIPDTPKQSSREELLAQKKLLDEEITQARKQNSILRQLVTMNMDNVQRLAKSCDEWRVDLEEERAYFIKEAGGELLGPIIDCIGEDVPEFKEIYELDKLIDEIQTKDEKALALRFLKEMGDIFGRNKIFKITMKGLDKASLAILTTWTGLQYWKNSTIEDSIDTQMEGYSNLVDKYNQRLKSNTDYINSLESARDKVQQRLDELNSKSGQISQGAGVERQTDLYFSKFSTEAEKEELGGVDFSSIRLNYISVDVDREGDRQPFKYMFKLTKASNKAAAIDFEESAKLSLEAFLVGLSLPNDEFWVNLVPWDTERVVGERLGMTDVGRIMLEADLQMKKDFARHINPCGSEVGRTFVALLDDRKDQLVTECMNMYQGQIYSKDNVVFGVAVGHWISPAKVTAYGNGKEICVTDATLDILPDLEMLSWDFEIVYQDTSAVSQSCLNCLKQATEKQAQYYMELENEMVLPLVVNEVNNGTKYAGLRQVYVSLALAQWYKKQTGPESKFARLINSGDLTGLESEAIWNPADIHREYVKSFQEGEFYCETRKNLILKRDGETSVEPMSYSMGGVKFWDISKQIHIIGTIDSETMQMLNKSTRGSAVNRGNEYYIGYESASTGGGFSPVYITLIVAGIIVFWLIAWRVQKRARW